MPDPLDGFQPVQDPLAGFKPVDQGNLLQGAAPAQRQMSPDEFGALITGRASLPGESPLATQKRLRVANWKGLPATNPDELLSMYGIDPTAIGPQKALEAFLDYKGMQSSGRSSGALDSLLRGAQRGISSPIQGVGQLANHVASGLMPDSPEAVSSAAASDLDARMRADLEAQQNAGHGAAFGTGEVLGGLPYAAMLPADAGVLGMAGAGAAFGASEPVTNPNFLNQKVGNTLTGMVAAPVAQMGLEGLVSLASKSAGAARGLTSGWLPPEQAAIQQNIMDRLGITKGGITAADLVAQPGKISKVRDMVSRAPFGGMDALNAQNNAQAGNAVGGMLQGADQGLAETPVDAFKALTNAAANGDKKAANILKNLPQQSDLSPGKSIQSSLEAGSWEGQKAVDPLYQQAEALKPVTPNDVTPIIATINEQIAAAQSSGKSARMDKVVDFLSSLKSDLQGQTDPKVEATLNALFKTPEAKANAIAANPQLQTGTPGMTTLGDLENLKGNVASEIQKILKGSPDALTGSDKTHYLTEVSHAFDPVMNAAYDAAPEYATAKKAADDAFKAQVAPYKESIATGLVKSGNERVTPDVAAGAVTKYTPNESAALNSILGPRGKAAQYDAFVNELVGSAQDATKAPGYQFDRAGFLNKAQSLKDSMSTAATPAQRDLMDGTVQALQYMSQLGVNKSADIARQGVMNKGLSEMMVAFKPLLTSDTGKALLLTLSWTKDPAMKNSILQRIGNLVESAAAPMGGQFNENNRNPVNTIPQQQ